MPDLHLEPKHLERLNELIAEAELRIDEQRKVGAELQRDGHPNQLAQRFLRTMENTLLALKETRLIAETTLDRIRARSSPPIS